MKLIAAVIFFSLSVNLGLAQTLATTSSSAEEIQVLIDVSGSMKQNDPQNLRVAATQLLIKLLPDSANVSLWLFAEQTSLLSHTDAANEEWREEALKASNNIHSRGVYTHLEDAIQTTLEQGFAGNGAKSLIILTDGLVDISKDIMVSADSRERILSEWIPKLQLQKIKVQTIALSDQVDKELLDKLAFDTGGWSETAQSADQLQRLFLKTALKIAPKDLLPLENNTFKVDSGIKEFSVLLFKQKNASPTQLIQPDQHKINRTGASEAISWLETGGYDLITVKQPMAGEWRIEAAFDPDNQVMILTDLKLQLNEIASTIGDKHPLTLKLHFTEQGKLISRADFLALVNLTLNLDQQPPVEIEASGTEAGFFSKTLENLAMGRHSIAIVADGNTFKREIKQDFEVVSAPVTVETLVDNASRDVTLKFHPDIAVLDASSLSITAKITQSGHEPESQIIKEQDGEWLLKLPRLAQGGAILVNFDAAAKNIDGSSVSPVLGPIRLDDDIFAPADTVSPAPQIPSAAMETASGQSVESEAKDPTTTLGSQNDTNWGVTIGVVLAINMLLCGIGFVIYKLLKRSIDNKQQELLEKLG